MKVTELLVTGYNGDDPVFAVTLGPGEAIAVLANADDGGVAVDAVVQQRTDVFASVRELLEGLTAAAAHA